ncbi:hypothetical protein [Acinetobacter baumannii]|uniref:hypothetical protein n=1 Tax=Acinetobacter baumannii TaxID=470 RepID=UPI002543D3FC|nr:hypothetical protein [Acinetobacter baumannii]WIH75481.1 hypothetical protein M2A29_05520 [Acinetobacter baumannii]
MSNNPETIEIHGLNTIHKLCNFAADRDMEGSSFTEIVERMFIELNAAKTQSEPVWTSTEFMLPDDGDLVLGISTTKLAKFNVYQVVALDEFEECGINYWMPLPNAPSEAGAQQ